MSHLWFLRQMFNAIRYDQYVNHYLNAVTNLYKNIFPFIPVTYYKASETNSIYDNTILSAGSYNIIGPSSGLKYYKIYEFPVAYTQAMVPVWKESDFGIRTDITTSVMFPKINFIPNSFDFISFKNKNISDEEIFQISNVETTYYDKSIPFYKADLMGSGNFRYQIDEQTIGEYGYVDFTNNIYDYNIFKLIKHLVANMTILGSRINNNVNQFTGLRSFK